MDKASNRPQTNGHSLSSYLSPAGAWSFALGTSIGWGSLVITSQTYLANAGPAGSIVGIVLGMGVMFIIATCYRFLMVRHEGAGGIYAYARDTFGYDHGTLIAWFMLLIYAAMLWANATSIQLFARYFVGDLFQIGFHYTIFGYDVYFGETVVTIAAIVLTVLLCTRSHKLTVKLMEVLVCVFFAGIAAVFAVSMLGL
jgi:amino acid transporter